MIIRIVIYLFITLYFLWDYRKDKKKFKMEIIPTIAITFLASTDYFKNFDNRLQLSLLIIAILFTLRYVWSYYKDNKIESFKEKKRIRAIREQDRIKRDEEILEQIFVAKNEEIRNKSRSYEILMEFSGYKKEFDGQLTFSDGNKVPENNNEYEIEEENLIEEIPVLENQIDMFK